jgi:GT2 family glycosyltransferase
VPEVAVVVLTFDPPDGLFEACVASVGAAGGWQRLVVVDNGGRARARLAALAEPVDCDLVVPGTNLGFAGGMNLGIEHAIARGATHVMLLNDDATVSPGWIESLLGELVAAEQHRERLGAVQPMLVFATDPPTVNSMGVALGSDGAGTDVGYGSPVPEFAAAPHDIGIFTGGAVLLSAAFLADVGGFDARFFLYYEDVDLALRGAERGWRYRCVPGVQVRHVGSASTGRRPDVAVYHRERNRLWLSVRRLRHAPRGVHARALVAGVAGAPRLLRARRH